MAELTGAVSPALPAAAVIAAVAADEGGYAVKLSDDCPLDGRFEIGSATKTMTGMVLASLVNDQAVALGDPIGRWLDAGQMVLASLVNDQAVALGDPIGRWLDAGQGLGSRVQGHARGHPVPPWTHHLCGAGGVEASAEDMARYLSACLMPPDSAAGRAIRAAQQAHHRIDPLRSAGLGWALGPPGYLGHDGGTAGFRAMLGLRPPACRAAGVFVNDRAAPGLPLAVRRSLDRQGGN